MTVKNLSIQGLMIGKNFPVRVESMLKIPLSKPAECFAQLKRLHSEGCELVRIALPSMDWCNNLGKLIRESPIPIMADIHFDHKLALKAMQLGCKAIRINPGNMKTGDGLRSLVACAKDHGTIIRIGANSGSVNSFQLKKADGDVGQALFIAVEEQIHLLLDNNFEDIILSAKSTNVLETVKSNILLSDKYPDFPFHVGVTEAGPGYRGITKSTAGLSLLLSQGIGDTIRVSLTDIPEIEVKVAFEILRSLDLRHVGPEVISCPTCGRKRIEVQEIMKELVPFLGRLPDGFKIAVMGCEVNGPREAKNADLGIAGTMNGFVIFKKGRVIYKCNRGELKKVLSDLIEAGLSS